MRGVWAFSIALAGCYSPRPAPGAPCGPNETCPEGLVCSLGTCERSLVDAPEPPGDANVDVPPGQLVISGVSPAVGRVGTVVTIEGAHFGDTPGGVALAGVAMSVESWTDTAIVAVVPDVTPRDTELVVSTGGMTDAAPFMVVLPPAVYLSNDIGSPDTVSVMTFDAETATLTPLGLPVSKQAASFATSGCLQTITVNEPTRRVFTTADDAIAVFDIDPRTGGLTLVTSTNIPSGRSYGVVSNAAGTRVYVASPTQASVSGFAVAASGALSDLPGSPYPANGSFEALAFSEDEAVLYASQLGGALTTLEVAATGALTRTRSTGTNNTIHVRRRPGTGQLFLAGGGALSVFSTVSGTTDRIPGSPFSVDSLNGAPVFAPGAARLYIPRERTGQLFAFDLDVLGTPTPIAGSPFAFDGDYSCGAVSRDGAFLVVAGESTQEVSLFRLGSQGAPTEAVGSPFRHSAPQTDVSGIAITF